MSGMSRDKGIRAERAVVNWLQTNGFPTAERRGAGFTAGDIIGIPGLTLEIKDAARNELAAWTDQLTAEMQADGNEHGAVIWKRRRKTDVGEWYATLPVAVFAHLAREAGYGQPNHG